MTESAVSLLLQRLLDLSWCLLCPAWMHRALLGTGNNVLVMESSSFHAVHLPATMLPPRQPRTGPAAGAKALC